jgi:hypothetical protein
MALCHRWRGSVLLATSSGRSFDDVEVLGEVGHLRPHYGAGVGE